MTDQENSEIFPPPAVPPAPPRAAQEIRPKEGQARPAIDPGTRALIEQMAADIKRAADALVYACREQCEMLKAHREASKAIAQAQAQAQRGAGPTADPY